MLPREKDALLLIEPGEDGYSSVLIRRDAQGGQQELARITGELIDIAVNEHAAVVLADYKVHRVDLAGGGTESPGLSEEWTSVAANTAGFLLGGYGNQLLAAADGRAWTAREFKAPGEGTIARLNLAGPQAIALRTVSREENGWGIISSEICLRDPRTGVWRKVAGFDGGNVDAPLHQLDWVGDCWLARGPSLIVTVRPTGAVEVIHPEPMPEVYADMSGDEVITKEGDVWRMHLFTSVIESSNLTNWRVVKSYSHEGVDGLWFTNADGAAQWFGVIGSERKPGPLAWSAVVAALEKPKPAPEPVVVAQPKPAPKPTSPVIADADLMGPQTATEPEPKTGLEFFNRGIKRLKELYDNEGAIADFKRSAELGIMAGMYNYANLAMQGNPSNVRAHFAQACAYWYRANLGGLEQIVEDSRDNPDL
ncbi:MAG: hypothetical protein IT582_10630, partial [Opitutaceae bacterium]|nr:hypothetical protein [Opitutaceae bacterium]